MGCVPARSPSPTYGRRRPGEKLGTCQGRGLRPGKVECVYKLQASALPNLENLHKVGKALGLERQGRCRPSCIWRLVGPLRVRFLAKQGINPVGLSTRGASRGPRQPVGLADGNSDRRRGSFVYCFTPNYPAANSRAAFRQSEAKNSRNGVCQASPLP